MASRGVRLTPAQDVLETEQRDVLSLEVRLVDVVAEARAELEGGVEGDVSVAVLIEEGEHSRDLTRLRVGEVLVRHERVGRNGQVKSAYRYSFLYTRIGSYTSVRRAKRSEYVVFLPVEYVFKFSKPDL